jgi:hypothetical protein
MARHFLRRHWAILANSALVLGLAVNVGVQNGAKTLLIVMAALSGFLLVVGSVGWLTGAQVVKHARREAAAIETGTHPMKKEIGR